MEMFWLVAFLTLTSFQLADTFILPLKTTNGSLDVEHLVGHMTLLEQTITGFKQTIKSQDADIAALKTEIAYMKASYNLISGHATEIASLKTEMSTLKANQPVITSHHADIASLKTEMLNLRANHQKLETMISDLQKQGQPSQISAEMTSLKNEVDVAKTDVAQVSSEVISLTSKVSNLTQDYQTLSTHMKNEVNAAKTDVTQVSNEVISLVTKFNNLTHSWQASSGQNLTGTVHAIQDKLTDVLSRVQSAHNDRILLHHSVKTLNNTVFNLNNNLVVNTSALSAQIALLKTEVGFNIWLGPSEVHLQASNYTTLKFSNIQYNKGNGYNTTTGVFTAPVPGTYLFWTQVSKTSGSPFFLHLKKGNRDIGQFYTTREGYVTGSVITAAAVTAGEQVSVTVWGAGRIDNSYNSRFVGILLYRH